MTTNYTGVIVIKKHLEKQCRFKAERKLERVAEIKI